LLGTPNASPTFAAHFARPRAIAPAPASSGTRARYLSKNQPVIFDRRFRPDPAHDPSVFTPAAYLQRLVFAYHSGRIPASTPDRDH